MKVLFTAIVLLFSFGPVIAQCGPGQIELTMNIYTDSWPYETYWQLVPSGSECGTGILAEGSNLNVGCAGTAANNSPDGYDANTSYLGGPVCLEAGSLYDIIFVDSYGDGGLAFELFENGLLTHVYHGLGYGNTWSFEAGNSNAPAYDQPCNAVELVINGDPLLLNNTNAIAAINEIGPPGVDCGVSGFWCEGGVTNSVWAYFIPEAGISYEISTCNPSNTIDTQIALWHASDCSDFFSFELISSNDDQIGGCSQGPQFSSVLYASCLIPGDKYYIQVDGWSGETGIIGLTVHTFQGAVSLNANVYDVSCPVDKIHNPDGAILPYIFGSGSGFSCSWIGPDGFYSDDHFINSLYPGDYELTAISDCGDVLNASFTINAPSQWNVIIDEVSPDCPQSENGALNSIVDGATAPYSYYWSGPGNFTATSANITNLTSGTYVFIVTDDHGCTFEFPYHLSAEDALTIDLGNDTTVCLDAEWIVSGPAGYNYIWQDGSNDQFYTIDAGDWGTGTHALILTAGTDDGCSDTDVYSFTVDDCLGVEQQDNFDVRIFPNPSDGLLTIQQSGDEALLIQIFDGAGRMVFSDYAVNPQRNHELIHQLSAGYYNVKIQQGNKTGITKLIVKN